VHEVKAAGGQTGGIGTTVFGRVNADGHDAVGVSGRRPLAFER
jgi:hypothetical protein